MCLAVCTYYVSCIRLRMNTLSISLFIVVKSSQLCFPIYKKVLGDDVVCLLRERTLHEQGEYYEWRSISDSHIHFTFP